MTTFMSAGAPLIVVMGVSGCGKTSVGSALADRLGVPFEDAHDLHSPASLAKLSAGIPLDDDDRAPWLRQVGDLLAQQAALGLVIACSALRESYRDDIRRLAPHTLFVHLDVTRDALAARMVMRSMHAMPLNLLETQLATLEPLAPRERGITVDATQRIDVIVSLAERAAREAVSAGA